MTVVFYLNVNGFRETYPSIVRFIKTLLLHYRKGKKYPIRPGHPIVLIIIIYLLINGTKVELTLNNSPSGIFHLYQYIKTLLCLKVNSTARIETT